MAKEILDKRPITNVEAKTFLEGFEKHYKENDKELGYEVEQSLRYSKKFSKVTETKAKALKKKLESMGIKDNLAVELVNIMPKHQDTVKAILLKRSDFSDYAEVLKVLEE